MDFVSCSYEGDEVDGTQHGHGKLTFPNGNMYEGGFHMGKFHGEGVLHLANGGGKYVGTWHFGDEQSGKLIFDDNLEFKDKDWKYCSAEDRRFQSEQTGRLQAAGATKLSDRRERSELPIGCFDVVEGYFDPGTGKIHAFGTGKDIRTPDAKEVKWIREKCAIGTVQPEKQNAGK